MTAAAAGQKPARTGPSRLATGLLLLPATIWYALLLVAPLLIVVVFSVGEQAPNGGYAPGLTLDNYGQVLERPDPFVASLRLATVGTILTLLIALPLAYFIATRAGRHKGLLVLLIVIPFWTSFLIRTYSWLIILGPRGAAGFVGDLVGDPAFRILGTDVGVLIGMVYGYLPLMFFPLYVTLERMDRTLVDASKDLGAARWATFRQITLPIILPGVITGSILVFIPMMGEYVIPAILGYGRTFLIGNALVLDFLEARDWPAGSAKAVGLIFVMMVTITVYLWFVNRGRRTREVSVL
jgi:spermidine/putrescine transport system permease protein